MTSRVGNAQPRAVAQGASSTSTHRLAANRRNALHSTGPRTASGKVTSSRNAVHHGLRALTPVVPGEREADWRAHLAAVTANLAPAGYLEECLADRVALQFWRLRRVVRYERETLALLHESAPDVVRRQREDDVNHFRPTGPMSVSDADSEVEHWREIREVLEAMPTLPDDATLAGAAVFELTMFLAQFVVPLPSELMVVLADGRSVPLDDVGLDGEPWPAAAVRLIVETIAGDLGRDYLLDAALDRALEREELAEEARDALVAEIDALRRRSILPDGPELDKLSRYEAGLERSLMRTLHELQRLQAARQGGSAPLALDVDLAVS